MCGRLFLGAQAFFPRVLRCKLNETEFFVKTNTLNFFKKWQIKTSDNELDKSASADFLF